MAAYADTCVHCKCLSEVISTDLGPLCKECRDLREQGEFPVDPSAVHNAPSAAAPAGRKKFPYIAPKKLEAGVLAGVITEAQKARYTDLAHLRKHRSGTSTGLKTQMTEAEFMPLHRQLQEVLGLLPAKAADVREVSAAVHERADELRDRIEEVNQGVRALQAILSTDPKILPGETEKDFKARMAAAKARLTAATQEGLGYFRKQQQEEKEKEKEQEKARKEKEKEQEKARKEKEKEQEKERARKAAEDLRAEKEKAKETAKESKTGLKFAKEIMLAKEAAQKHWKENAFLSPDQEISPGLGNPLRDAAILDMQEEFVGRVLARKLLKRNAPSEWKHTEEEIDGQIANFPVEEKVAGVRFEQVADELAKQRKQREEEREAAKKQRLENYLAEAEEVAKLTAELEVEGLEAEVEVGEAMMAFESSMKD